MTRHSSQVRNIVRRVREFMHTLFAGIHSLSFSLTLIPSLFPPPSHTHTTEAPSIQDPVPEQNRTVQQDETLTIPVIVQGGVPSPTITWRRDSTELVNGSGRVSISNTGALTVTGVTQNDRGNYSLGLSNTGGSLTRYFSVFVPCE